MQTVNKQQYISQRIAGELLVQHLKGQIKLRPVKQYAEDYGVGTGTVQSALQALKDCEAIELNACGASGTFLASVNRRKLFDACGYGDLICLMPLDANREMRSLATGIYECVSEEKLPIHILFARGSKNRINMINRGKCDFAVMSRLAYDTSLRVGSPEIDMVGTIGKYPGRVGCITRAGEDFDPSMKVAFDRYSYDQLALHTELGLHRDPMEDCLDVQLAGMVRKRDVAAALGRFFEIDSGLCFHPLEALAEETERKLHEAVLVVRKGEDSLKQLLKSIVQMEKVTAIQGEIISGNRMVKY